MSYWTGSRSLGAASAVLAALATGCNPNPFCLNCAVEDGGAKPDFVTGGNPGGDDMAQPPDLLRRFDGCPMQAETCNGEDDDCNNMVDDVPMDKLCQDPNNCGRCGNTCAYAHAYGICGGLGNCTCQMGACQPGFYDLDKASANGCEYACIPTPPHKCMGPQDCPFGIACTNGSCAQPCQSNANCPMNTICDPVTKLCEGDSCDGVDNNCDGVVDEGVDLKTDINNCGSCNNACNFPNAAGACMNGVCTLTACKQGFADLDKTPGNGCEYACQVFPPVAEACNGKDDDCNGMIDDSPKDVGGACDDFCPALAGCVGNNSCTFPRSACMGKCCGVCTQGMAICAGGQRVCQAGSGPKLEVCNGTDDNCDGQIDEGFDLKIDVLNCGKCGTACMLPNAVPACAAGACVIATCKLGFADLDKNPANGCEYTCPVNPPTVETCNGKDDDCNGQVDDSLTPPNNFCVQTSVCAGSRPVCCAADGWICNYVSVNNKIEVSNVKMCAGGQMAGTLAFSEMRCDAFDGNCNGQSDESFVNLGKQCFVGQGACRGSSNFICDPNNALQLLCPAMADNSKAADEACDDIDNDCDGAVDEPTDGPNMCMGRLCKGWHDTAVMTTLAGKNVWVYQYEASRTDASVQAAGNGTTRACSRPGVLPWAPVTWTQADAACKAIKDSKGVAMRLCSAAEWSNACSVGNGAASVWGFAANPTVYNNGMGIDNSKVCNGFDQNLNKVWAGGVGANCYANQGGGKLFDMSGNVAEWTSTSVSYMNVTYYKVRGGAYNNYSGGLACNFDFVIETPSYQLGDLGFRCCADNAP